MRSAIRNRTLSGDYDNDIISHARSYTILKPFRDASPRAGSSIIVVVFDQIVRITANHNPHFFNFEYFLFKRCDRYFCHFETPFMRV